MANDRLFIRCTRCNEFALVGKYYPSCPEVWEPDPGTTERIRTFVNKHLVGLDACQAMLSGGEFATPMTLVFESEGQLLKAVADPPAKQP